MRIEGNLQGRGTEAKLGEELDGAGVERKRESRFGVAGGVLKEETIVDGSAHLVLVRE